tara:strand:- start:88 stop:1407 length:1320 start_codon:yes stop_codon:yes gene_type:complete
MLKEEEYLKKLAESFLTNLKKSGASESSVLISNSISETVNIRNKKLDGATRSDSLNVVLTAYVGKKKSSISSSNLEENHINELIIKCVDTAKVTPEDELNSLPDSELYFKGIKNLDLYDETFIENSRKIDFIKEAEEQAFKKKEIVNTNGSGFSQNKSNFILANSNGFIDGYKSSNFSAYCEVVAKSNGSMERDYEYSSKRFFKDLLKPKKIGQKASELAINKLKPKKIKSKKMKVVFDKRIAKNFLSSFAGAITSGTIAKGSTFLKDKLNTQIFNDKINIIDKPDIIKGSGSRYFDIEGTSTNELKLVENGILKNYLIDTYSGKKINMKSNGRASGTTNLFFENGHEDYKNLLNSSKEIVYINETFGNGVNIITGDYSVGASGFMVENGEFIYPISEITIAGNLNEIFNKMVLGNDLEFNYSTNSPTMFVDELTIGGK